MNRLFARLREDRATLFFLLSASLALLACALRTLALFLRFDTDIGYFHSGAPLVIAAHLCTALCALICVIIPFLINIGRHPEEKDTLPAPRFLSAAVCAAALCVAAFYLLTNADKVPAPAPLVLLTALSLLAGAVYFLLRLLSGKPRSTVAFGFFVILAAALCLATTYFDRYTQMNAPHKLSLHLCMLAIMFGMLYELRALLGRALPRACTAATTLAAALCFVYSLSNTIAFLGGVYDDVTYFLFDLVTLGFAAYFTTKCLRLAVPPIPEKTEVEQ